MIRDGSLSPRSQAPAWERQLLGSASLFPFAYSMPKLRPWCNNRVGLRRPFAGRWTNYRERKTFARHSRASGNPVS